MDIIKRKYKGWHQDGPLLAQGYGIELPEIIGFTNEMPPKYAYDNAPIPITQANNSGLLQFFNYIDPSVIDIIISPLNAEKIYGSTVNG